MLACNFQSGGTTEEPTQPPAQIPPTYTSYPTYTTPPTERSRPTVTTTPRPTFTPRPTNTPLPPKAWIWSSTLSELYEEIYALGYSAEMYHHEDGYWLISFDDLNSYFQAEGWWWYGNSILAWAGEGGNTDSIVDQIGLRKNYLTFPTSDIDGKAIRFFSTLLEEFGYEQDEIDHILEIASDGLVDARSAIGEHLCFGQLPTGEYIAVRLLAGEGYYVYYVDLRTFPICVSGSPGQEG